MKERSSIARPSEGPSPSPSLETPHCKLVLLLLVVRSCYCRVQLLFFGGVAFFLPRAAWLGRICCVAPRCSLDRLRREGGSEGGGSLDQHTSTHAGKPGKAKHTEASPSSQSLSRDGGGCGCGCGIAYMLVAEEESCLLHSLRNNGIPEKAQHTGASMSSCPYLARQRTLFFRLSITCNRFCRVV